MPLSDPATSGLEIQVFGVGKNRRVAVEKMLKFFRRNR